MSLETATRCAIRRYTRNRTEVRELFAADPTIAATAVDALAVTLRESLHEAVLEAELGALHIASCDQGRRPHRGPCHQSSEVGTGWDPEKPYGCPFCGGSFTDFGLRAHACPAKINNPDAERAHENGA